MAIRGLRLGLGAAARSDPWTAARPYATLKRMARQRRAWTCTNYSRMTGRRSRHFPNARLFSFLGRDSSERGEFVGTTRELIATLVGPGMFSSIGFAGLREGAVAFFAEPCIGTDLGVAPAAAARQHSLALSDNGAALEKLLGQLALPFIPGSGTPTGAAATAAQYWRLISSGGSTSKPIVILRKRPVGTTEYGALYNLPVVVVDIDPGRSWSRLVARALGQSLAGLGDEYTRGGPDWAAPPTDWVTSSPR